MAKITSVSPLAPAAFPDLPVIDGVRFAAAAAGVRYEGRTDVMLALLAPGSTVAGVFTLGEIGVISPAYCRMAHRGKGVALALMASVLEHCRRSLFKHVIVDRSDSCPAIAFYERLGFSRVASYRRYRRAVQ